MARNLRFDLTSDTGWQSFSDMRRGAVLSGKRFIVELVGEKRSLDQNALSFEVYKEVSEQLGDQTADEVRRESKLRYGIPILRGDENFRKLYDKSIKHTLDYSEKLEAMEWFPVTRLMNKKQFSEYLDTVIREYSKQGIYITMPGDAA